MPVTDLSAAAATPPRPAAKRRVRAHVGSSRFPFDRGGDVRQEFFSPAPRNFKLPRRDLTCGFCALARRSECAFMAGEHATEEKMRKWKRHRDYSSSAARATAHGHRLWLSLRPRAAGGHFGEPPAFRQCRSSPCTCCCSSSAERRTGRPALLHFVAQGTVKVVTVSGHLSESFPVVWMAAGAQFFLSASLPSVDRPGCNGCSRASI